MRTRHQSRAGMLSRFRRSALAAASTSVVLVLAGLSTVALTGTASAVDGEVYDNFNGTGSVGGSATESGGKTWQAINGTWTRAGNGTATTATSPASNPMLVADMGSADVDARMTTTGSSGETLFFRVQDASNWLRVRLSHGQTPVTTTTYPTEYQHQDYYTDSEYAWTYREWQVNVNKYEWQWQDRYYQREYSKTTYFWLPWYNLGPTGCTNSPSAPSNTANMQYQLVNPTGAGCSGTRKNWTIQARSRHASVDYVWVTDGSSAPSGYSATGNTRYQNSGSAYWGTPHAYSGMNTPAAIGSRVVLDHVEWQPTQTAPAAPSVLTTNSRIISPSQRAWWRPTSAAMAASNGCSSVYAWLGAAGYTDVSCWLTGQTARGATNGSPYWSTTPCAGCPTRVSPTGVTTTTYRDDYHLRLGNSVNGVKSNLGIWDIGGPTSGFRVTAEGSTVKVYNGNGAGTLVGTATVTDFASQARHGCGLSGEGLVAPTGSLDYCYLKTATPPPPACPPAVPDQYGGTEGGFTPVNEVLAFDTNLSGSISPGAPRNVAVAVPNVDPADIDRLVVCVISDWQAAGTLTVSSPDDAEPATPTISRSTAEPTTKLVSTEVEPSLTADPGTIRISTTGSTPRVRLLVQGWYGWDPDLVEQPPALDESDPMWLHQQPDGEMQIVGEDNRYKYSTACVTVQDDAGNPTGLCSETVAPALDPPDNDWSGCKNKDPDTLKPVTLSRTAACNRYGQVVRDKDSGGKIAEFVVTERIDLDFRNNRIKYRWQLANRYDPAPDDSDYYGVRVYLRCEQQQCDVPQDHQSEDTFGGINPEEYQRSVIHSGTILANIGNRVSADDPGRTLGVSTYLKFKVMRMPPSMTWVNGGNGPDSADIRCDNLRYLNAGHGCVFPQRRTIFILNHEAYPITQSAEFNGWAQGVVDYNWGRMVQGRLDLGYPMTRLWGPKGSPERKQMNKNRRWARKDCRAHGTRLSYQSCDEYPYASTYQGCASNGEDPSPPYSNCRGRFLNATHNSNAGTQLNQFFQRYRILDEGDNTLLDRFFVSPAIAAQPPPYSG